MASAVTLFQRNKQLYVEGENKLEAIISDDSFLQVFQTWLNTNISQLDFQYERCEQQLSELQQNVAVTEGSFWCSKTIIDHCNLHMAERRLVKKGECLQDHAQLPELIQLISCLQQTKTHSFMTPKQRRFIEQVEEELKTIVLSPRELNFITNALHTKLQDDGNTRGVFGDLTSFQNTIEDLSPDIEQCEQLLEASIANGEMGLAEDISRRQLEIFEHILKLITDQYPAISSYYSESRNSDRGRRWAIFRMANKDITTVIEGKYRQVEACEEDLIKIRDQMDNYNCDDDEQRRRYEKDRGESDDFLLKNKEKQQSVWNRIFDLYKQLENCVSDLSSLASQRRKEVDRRLQMEEREAGRRSGHQSFLQAAAVHAQKLQDTIDNALAVKDVAQALNNFVLDGCDSITAKYDKQQNALSEMLRLVQQHHFRRFSDYYIATSRYLYRKERRLEQIEAEMDENDMHRELLSDSLNPCAKEYAEANVSLALKRREVAQEVLHIRHKLEKAEKAISPTLRSLDFAGVAYTPPHDIVAKMNLNRWSSILDFREAVDPAIPPLERVRREEVEALRRLREYAGRADAPPNGFRQVAAASSEPRGAPQSAFAKRVHAMLQKQMPPMSTSAHEAAARRGKLKEEPSVGGEPSSTVEAAPLLPPILPARMEGSSFRAVYSYKARAPDELSFEEGQKIVCINRAPEEGWFKGVCNQRTGLFPINYVEPCRDDA